MKSKRKPKSHAKRRVASLRVATPRTRQIYQHGPIEKESQSYSPMETGQPNHDVVPDIDNPQAVQGGLGPLNQEGEGERQNDQLAELEQIEPDINREEK